MPVTLGDGREWLVARCGLAKALTTVRDRMYAETVIHQKVKVLDLLGALHHGLSVNYDFTIPEFRGLIEGVDPATLAEPVGEAAIPIDPPRREFTAWARSALLANGISPADVPPADLPHVLDQLVDTGRAVPHRDYTDPGRAAAKRGGIALMARKLAAEKPKRDAPLATE